MASLAIPVKRPCTDVGLLVSTQHILTLQHAIHCTGWRLGRRVCHAGEWVEMCLTTGNCLKESVQLWASLCPCAQVLEPLWRGTTVLAPCSNSLTNFSRDLPVVRCLFQHQSDLQSKNKQEWDHQARVVNKNSKQNNARCLTDNALCWSLVCHFYARFDPWDLNQ